MGNVLGDKASKPFFISGFYRLYYRRIFQTSVLQLLPLVEQADVLAFNDPQTLRLMNGNYQSTCVLVPSSQQPSINPFWQHGNLSNLKKSKVAELYQSFAKKICKALKMGCEENIFAYVCMMPTCLTSMPLFIGDRLHVRNTHHQNN